MLDNIACDDRQLQKVPARFSVLLCCIKPILNRTVPGFLHERAKGYAPTIENRERTSSPCPPWAGRILTLHLNCRWLRGISAQVTLTSKTTSFLGAKNM